jgi:glycosyltransferase involved in cell wall biosynthesis
VEKAIAENRLPQLRFLIATKSEFEIPLALAESSRVVIQKGRPLSDEEINEYYATTFVVWNAYVRTTQSGVLAKSFMFGTPAIVLKKNLSEFTVDGQEVAAIDDNTSFEEIEKAVLRITENFDHYSLAARKRFEETFYYRQYNETFSKILSSL